ncbi:MAG: S1 RNA-binding domain-containing protein, partial [Planctomycetaceae bacterium]|nr:S1 RNA-binding domain-containing protein [Planctomycetaceae bacterium]
MSSGDQAPTDGQEPTNASTPPAPGASEAAEPQAVEASGETHSETTEDATAAAPSPESAPPETTESKPENPLSKRARVSGPLAARGLGVAKPASPSVSTEDLEAAGQAGSENSGKGKPGNKKSSPRPRLAGDKPKPKRPQQAPTSKVAIPNARHALPDDIQAELDAELAATDVEAMLSGPAGMANRAEPLTEGASVQGQVLKIHDDNVFVALGGPDEGVVAFDQFEQEPAIGDSIEVLVRGISREDGLYALGLPGSAIEASDWEDIDEGSVVEVTVTGSNSGGLECKVGGAKGFIPISQISEYRVEDTTEFVDQKFRCVVTESSQKRGNLVLSRRAILEREREEKRKEQLEQIEVGDELQGTVRTIKDFGAFVDL